uniref:Uncharacterized protein n=1 Tax=Lepeophtheirus salmonis TaxID=72036 RepID=A0A0K2TED2_LEPSM
MLLFEEQKPDYYNSLLLRELTNNDKRGKGYNRRNIYVKTLFLIM